MSDDIRGQLATISDGARGELEARQQAAQPAEPPKQPEVQAEPAQKAAEPAPKVEEPAQPVAEAPKAPEKKVAAQAEPAPMPDEVMALLGDTRAPADLSVDELKGRAKAARGFSKDNSLPKDIRAQLAGLAKDARTELAAREQQQAAPQAEPKVDAPAIVQEAPKVEAPKAEAPVVTEAPKTDAPVVTEAPKTDAPVVVQEAPKLDAPAVVQEVPKGDAPAVAQETPKVDAPVVQDAPKVDLPPVAAVAAPAAADVKVLDSNAGDPASEKQAKAYLADGNPIDQLSDEDLRTRLDNIRDLMAGNELSRDTERAVRDKLKGERAVLRQRLAVKEAAANAKVAASKPEEPAPKPDQSVVSASMPPLPAAPATAPPPPPLPPAAAGSTTTNNTTITNTTIITNITPAIVVLRDTRPAEELRVTELQRRVQVYNDAQFDDSYDEENRNYWRGSLERDREILRRRLIDERRRRAEQLALNADNSGINIDINIDLSPGRPRPRRDVFAAEVDEQELEDVLVAPPRQVSKRRYSLEEVALEPKIRQSVNRIEIDTIRFGTNQSFIREEQVNSLDGIAAIIERIVKKYPNEVFLVEGHTDAVGGAAQNDRLSKLRAEAVKKALVTYYVIPPENLRTVGLGERFLKIPTAEAEPENRRVSISRITQLLGDNQ